jgi:hypothetical protein
MRSRRTTLFLIAFTLLLVSIFAAVWYFKRVSDRPEIQVTQRGGSVLETTFANYHDEVLDASEEFDLPYAYLMSLIVLETSGKKPPGKRFEPAVYRRLTSLRDGKRLKYEAVRRKHVKNASDDAIRNLATSWGPFQLMGYKCVAMGVTVNDLRGGDGVEYGAEWIAEEYGHLLRRGRYKDAFHYHNTGRVYPKFGKPRTHDPRYVDRGLAYMEYFNEKLAALQ